MKFAASILVGLSISWAFAAESATPERSGLAAKLEAFVQESRFSGALWGVKIVSLDHGDVVFESHADRLMSPASNAKLYTGALALDRLGGDYRIATPIVATAAPDQAGVVNGNLIVEGRGDPSWQSRTEKRDFAQLFEPFVAAVERAGIHAITGDVIADATYFQVGPAGESWAADDLNEDFGAEISAISIEDNYADVIVTPAETVGSPCRIEILQPLTGIEIDNRTTTVAAGGRRTVRLVRLPGEKIARVFGTLPVGAKEEKTEVTIPRPSAWFAAGLKSALERKGIAVRGRSAGVRWPETPPARGAAFAVGEVRSTPMRELVKGFMKPSQNLETDLIFLHVGESRRRADTAPGLDANDLALAELHTFLCEYALRVDEVKFNEGSGLSRNDLTSAAATLSLLRFMHGHPEKTAFVDALPVAGVDGTLRRRFKSTPAENNLRAKTGSLQWASSLSGYVTTTSGEHLAFSLMLNRYSSLTGRSAPSELDALVALIVGYETEH